MFLIGASYLLRCQGLARPKETLSIHLTKTRQNNIPNIGDSTMPTDNPWTNFFSQGHHILVTFLILLSRPWENEAALDYGHAGMENA